MSMRKDQAGLVKPIECLGKWTILFGESLYRFARRGGLTAGNATVV